MFESRNRLFWPAIAVLGSIALGGCSASSDGEPFPAPPTEDFKALFNLATGAIPHPTDLFFAGSTDGTLNLPVIAYRPASIRDSLNTLDGWSITAPMTTAFSTPVGASTLSATTVKLIEMYFSNTTKGPAQGAELPSGVVSPVKRLLVYGTDYTAAVSDDVDSGGKIVKITPLKPLTPSSGGTNIGYLVILTNGIQSAAGLPAQPDDFYASIKAAPADCSTFTDPTQKAVCQLTKAHLSVAAATGTPADSVVLTWSFTTESTGDTFALYIAPTAAAKPTAVVPSGASSPGAKADIFVGSTQLPYYLTPAATPSDKAILTKFWTAAGPSPVLADTASRNLTRFNPVPLKVADVTVPILVTVPKSAIGCTKPATGWPLVIVQHGITGNRTQALAMADSFASACYVVASMDLPLHGLTPESPAPFSAFYCSPTTPNPACLGARERTFDVDLVNNTNTSLAVADGRVDASGTHMINLPSPLTSRDNLRQAEADLITFAKSVTTLDFDGGGPDVDATRISFVGLSLGSMTGTVTSAYAAGLRTSALAVPGGVITKLLQDSQAFGPSIIAGVGSQGLAFNSYLFNLYFRDFQAIIDSGDPVNYIKAAQTARPLVVFKVVGDAVIPNSATDRLIVAGGLTKYSSATHPVGPGTGAYVTFTQGSHGTLFDPTASPAATAEMQGEAVMFTATSVAPGGPFLTITNTAVIEP